MRSQRRRAWLAISAGLALLATTQAQAATHPTALAFGPAVRLTSTPFGGYEPGIKIDRYGNIFVTAHKQNFIDAAAPDMDAPVKVRSASWLWTSTDGRHFHDLAGLTPASLNDLEFGDEGDLALDHANNLYFIDTSITDVAVTQWHVSGPGQSSLTHTMPAIGSAEPVDDRPWITATGDGIVAYVSNEGDKVSYPLAADVHHDAALGPGRDTVYLSHDGGLTFDHIGLTLRDSGWCKPASDPRTQSRAIYVVCTNDSGANDVTDNPGGGGFNKGVLYAFVSLDEGNTWSRYRMGAYDGLSSGSWPDVSVDRHGVIRALFVDPRIRRSGYERDVLELWTSRDEGHTWIRQTVPTADDEVPYSALAVAPNGTVGVAYYSRPRHSGDWYVYAATSADHGGWLSAKVSQQPIAPPSGPYGDFFQIAYDRQSRLNVVWTKVTSLGPPTTLTTGTDSDIYFSRQR